MVEAICIGTCAFALIFAIAVGSVCRIIAEGGNLPDFWLGIGLIGGLPGLLCGILIGIGWYRHSW